MDRDLRFVIVEVGKSGDQTRVFDERFFDQVIYVGHRRIGGQYFLRRIRVKIVIDLFSKDQGQAGKTKDQNENGADKACPAVNPEPFFNGGISHIIQLLHLWRPWKTETYDI